MSSFDAIEWSDPMPPPSSDKVAATERLAAFKFPADFLEFCDTFHGGFPDPDEIEVVGFGRTMINQVLPFDDDEEESIRSIGTVFAAVEGLPEGLVPFASEPGGNYFCFSAGHTGDMEIVFWFHEENRVLPVCGTFSEFVELISES